MYVQEDLMRYNFYNHQTSKAPEYQDEEHPRVFFHEVSGSPESVNDLRRTCGRDRENQTLFHCVRKEIYFHHYTTCSAFQRTGAAIIFHHDRKKISGSISFLAPYPAI